MKLYEYAVALSLITTGIALSKLSVLSICGVAGSGVLCWWLTKMLVPKTREFMLIKKIFGYDINKKGSEAGEKEIPECMGIAAAVAFCMVMLLLVPVILRLGDLRDALLHLVSLTTILGTILLGFADDMLDLLWRYKLFFPLFIILPLVSVYDGVHHF